MIFAFDDFELDADTPELKRAGQPVKADTLVLRLLAVLVRSAGQLVTKQDLVAQVWDNRAVSENVITVSMVRLRKTLEHGPGHELVSNVRGRGYRFMRPVTARAAQLAPLLAHAAASDDGPPFVGREQVLARLRERARNARNGQGGALVLVGEPGIGKTRAIEVLEREAESEAMLVAWGHCREAGDTPPLWPFAQLIRGLLGRVPADPLLARLGPAAAELRRLLPELSRELAQDRARSASNAPSHTERASAGLGPKQAGRHRIVDAVARLLVMVAEHTPCVLVLDDLQRADAASLELLRYLIDELVHTRIALLCTLRPGDPSQLGPHLAYVLGHRNCERVALERLREADVQAYVAALLPDPEGALGHAVFVKSEGNPFFMVELSRSVRDAGRAAPNVLAVGDAALDLVRQRLATLDHDTHQALTCASLLGRSFELPLLQAVSGRDASALMSSLDRARAAHVIAATPDARTSFAFSHELLRAVLHDAIAPVDRRALHLRVVRALEQRKSLGDGVLAGELAYHAHAALPDGDLRAAVHYCSDAARAAAAVYANADVVRYLRHALEALDLMPEPSARARMGLLLRQALFARVDSSVEFERAIVEIVRNAREAAAGDVLAYAALLLDPHPGFPPLVHARGALADALHLLNDSQPNLRAAVLARTSTSTPFAFDADASRTQLERARELRGNDEPDAVLARYSVGVAALHLAGGPAQRADAKRLQSELEQLFAQHPRTLTVPPVLLEVHRAISALQDGKLNESAVALERAAARCAELNNRELSWHIARFRALLQLNGGFGQEPLSELEQLHLRAQRERILGTELFCAFDRCVILGRAVDPASPTLALESDDPPGAWSMRVRTLAAAGLHARAHAALHRVAPGKLERLPCDRDYLGTLGTLARAVIALGASEYQEPLYALLAPYPDRFAAHTSFLCEGSVSELLGLLALARGQSRAAIAHFEVAVALAEQSGLPQRAAESRAALVRARRATGG